MVLGRASASQHALHSVEGSMTLWCQLANSVTDVNPTHVTQRKSNGVNVGEATDHVNHTREPSLDVRQALICAEADV